MQTFDGVPFESGRKDSHGVTRTCLLPIIGTECQHVKNGKTYKVLDVVWNGDTDSWAILHKEVQTGPDHPAILRDHLNFFETVPPRYVLPWSPVSEITLTKKEQT